MQELREKCPWDQAQTPESLSKYAIEEAYEVEGAIRSEDVQHVKEELGDLLLQVVFQAQMYSEQGAFDFNDIVESLSAKLIRRHPHVFRADEFEQMTESDVAGLWKKIKSEEKQGKPKSRLDDIKHGPALTQAQQIQQSVAKIGFDFDNLNDAYAKLEEELQELNEAILHHNSDEIEDEYGDCLFSLINVGRKLGVSSEIALLRTIHKFKSRFTFMEDQAIQHNKNLQEMSLAEMDAWWDQAKQHFKHQAQLKQQAQLKHIQDIE